MEDLPPRFKSQDEWLATLRNGCNHCHALGMPQTRIYTTAKDWDAMFLRAVFQAEYFQVAPGLDLQVPIGLGYGLFGRSAVRAGWTVGFTVDPVARAQTGQRCVVGPVPELVA